MCLIFFAYKQHPDYRLIIAANRDEFYNRPTTAAAYWPDHPEVLAGRDLQAGGTWLGVTRSGRLAALTNYRDPAREKPDASSRGELVSRFLCSSISPADFAQELKLTENRYNGFNLIFGNTDSLWYFSNVNGKPKQLAPGAYGLTNHLLDTPWPKIKRTRTSFCEALQNKHFQPHELLDLLADTSAVPDDELPQTGVGITWERILAPVFVQSMNYGTRCSTVLAIDYDGKVSFTERSYLPGTTYGKDITYSFSLQNS